MNCPNCGGSGVVDAAPVCCGMKLGGGECCGDPNYELEPCGMCLTSGFVDSAYLLSSDGDYV